MFLFKLALLASTALPALAQVYVPPTPTIPPSHPKPTGWVTSLPKPYLPEYPPDYNDPEEPEQPYGAGAVKPQYGAWYSYEQKPLPTETVSAAPDLNPTLAPDTPPGTREYTFNLDYRAGYPDGFLRRLTVINGQFPGPMIEAVQGDTIVVHVNNNLDIPAAIHWHGIHQNTTQYMDGVPGFSQCPIPPGGSFTYTFPLVHELGTYWYHSHFGNTMADGLLGAFIVKAPDDPLIGQFDQDQLLYVADYWGDDSETIVHASKNPGGYRGCAPVDVPDSVIINGAGQVDCAFVQRDVPCFTEVPPAEIRAAPGKRVRLRLIHHGSHSIMYVSIDGHTLKVIEADDTGVQAFDVNELAIAPGERYSVVVELNQGQQGDSFWIRARAATGCYNGKWRVDGLAVLRYFDEAGEFVPFDMPQTTQWEGLADMSKPECRDMDDIGHSLIPLTAVDPPAVADETHLFVSKVGEFVDSGNGGKYIGWGFNGVAYTNYINDPLLKVVEDGRTIEPNRIAYAQFTGSNAADIIINQLDGAPHPFHLHGRPFSIVARGMGEINSTEGIEMNLSNPTRRDTLVIGPKSWVVLRLPLDNPGVWPLHCHIGWHLSVGKMAAVIVRPDLVQGFAQPEDWAALCTGDPSAPGPGRRSYVPPQIGALASTTYRTSVRTPNIIIDSWASAPESDPPEGLLAQLGRILT